MGAILTYFHIILLPQQALWECFLLIHWFIKMPSQEKAHTRGQWAHLWGRSGHWKQPCFWNVYSSCWLAGFHCCFMFILRLADTQISQELSSLNDVFFKNESCRLSRVYLLFLSAGSCSLKQEFILKTEKNIKTSCMLTGALGLIHCQYRTMRKQQLLLSWCFTKSGKTKASKQHYFLGVFLIKGTFD